MNRVLVIGCFCLLCGALLGALTRRSGNDVPVSSEVRFEGARSAGMTRKDSTNLPRFSKVADQGIQTDARASDYNPRLLMRLGVRAHELFEAEPRNEQWASTLEKELGPLFEKDLKKMVPSVSNVIFECRTKSCMLTYNVDAVDGNLAREAFRLLDYSPMRTYVTQGDAKKERVVLSMVRPDNSVEEPTAFLSGSAKKRSEIIDRYRSGQMELPKGLSKEQLP